MKKGLFAAAMAVTLALCLVGQYALAQTTLRYWTEFTADPDLPATEELIKKFMNENPEIKIKHRPIENEQFHTVVRTGFTGGDPPEICQLEGYEYVVRYAKPGQLWDVTDWIAKNEDRFLPGVNGATKWRDSYYGVPFTVDNVSQIFYNAGILKKYGISPPETWRELLVSCQKLKDNGVIPISLGNKYGWCGLEWWQDILIRSVGAERVWDLVTRKPGNHWTDPDIVQAAKLYEELSDWGFFPEGSAGMDWPAQMSLFFAGKTGYMHAQSPFVGELTASAPPDFEAGVMRMPALLGAKGPKDGVLYANCIVLSKSLKDKELGLKFLDFMSRAENTKIWTKYTQWLAAVKGGVTEDVAGPILVKIASIAEGHEDTIPWVGHVSPAPLGHGGPMYVGSIGILTGQQTAQSWMEWLETEAQKYEPVYKERL